jgi:hypothetical protein
MLRDLDCAYSALPESATNNDRAWFLMAACDCLIGERSVATSRCFTKGTAFDLKFIFLMPHHPRCPAIVRMGNERYSPHGLAIRALELADDERISSYARLLLAHSVSNNGNYSLLLPGPPQQPILSADQRIDFGGSLGKQSLFSLLLPAARLPPQTLAHVFIHVTSALRLIGLCLDNVPTGGWRVLPSARDLEEVCRRMMPAPLPFSAQNEGGALPISACSNDVLSVVRQQSLHTARSETPAGFFLRLSVEYVYSIAIAESETFAAERMRLAVAACLRPAVPFLYQADTRAALVAENRRQVANIDRFVGVREVGWWSAPTFEVAEVAPAAAAAASSSASGGGGKKNRKK